MESFQLLSRGGVKFDKKRFKADVQLFDRKYEQASEIRSEGKTRDDLPSELDFFKYTQGDAPKRKIRQLSSSHENGEASREETKRVKFDAVDKEEGPSQLRHRVTVKGSNIPDAVHTFEALQEKYDISPRIIQNLKEYGYTALTDIQSYATPIMLQGRDLAAISPTGTGKTLSYLVPIFSLLKTPYSSSKVTVGSGVRAVILAPTRELAHQIHNECMKIAQRMKWKMVLLSKATASTLADKLVRDKVDIIVSTPLRLVDSMQRYNLELDNVRHLVLDEADRLLDSEFLSQTQEVTKACMRENVQKVVFSATLPAGAEKIAMGALRDPARIIVGLKDTPLPSITQKLVYVADESSKLPTLLQYLSQPYSPPIMIFTSTQPRASSLAEQLVLNSVQNVDCLHAGMSMKERQDAASRMRKGDSWVMICTDVMGRGMDFKGVQGVINFDFPRSVQSYIHRIGRTGRAGREGSAITYFTDEDAPFLKPIANVLLQSGSTVPEWMLKLPKPSKMKRRDMGKIERGDAVTRSDRIGRMIAVKKREIIQASKRRKARDKLGHVVSSGVEEDVTDPRSDDGVSSS